MSECVTLYACDLARPILCPPHSTYARANNAEPIENIEESLIRNGLEITERHLLDAKSAACR